MRSTVLRAPKDGREASSSARPSASMSSGAPGGRRSSRMGSRPPRRQVSGQRPKSRGLSGKRGAAPPERRILLDTSVLISAIVFGGAPRSVLELGLRGQLRLVTSPYLLAELERVLVNRFRFSSDAAREVGTELEGVSLVVEPAEMPRISRDRADDEVLAAAHAGKAEWIVTGDDDLLALTSYAGIAIVRPRRFLDELD